MNSFSQNKEDKKVLRYFNAKKGTLLSVGENDGSMFSNARLMIECGWSAYLLEPASVFSQLQELHKGNDRVKCFNFGLGEKEETVKFYESKNHVKGGTDLALVSSINYDETVRWRNAGVEFEEKEIDIKTFNDFWEQEGRPVFNFITIDCEGNDWQVLKQIDLKEVGCECVCIEFNGDKDLEKKFTSHCGKYGLKEIHRNAENILFAIPQ